MASSASAIVGNSMILEKSSVTPSHFVYSPVARVAVYVGEADRLGALAAIVLKVLID
jgi:hypothetical protein